MSITINKTYSDKEIDKAMQKLTDRKKKEKIPLDKYFGKVTFETDGLSYQKKIRNEWQ